jgi:hypothetical protein
MISNFIMILVAAAGLFTIQETASAIFFRYRMSIPQFDHVVREYQADGAIKFYRKTVIADTAGTPRSRPIGRAPPPGWISIPTDRFANYFDDIAVYRLTPGMEIGIMTPGYAITMKHR